MLNYIYLILYNFVSCRPFGAMVARSPPKAEALGSSPRMVVSGGSELSFYVYSEYVPRMGLSFRCGVRLTDVLKALFPFFA
jgi:hypothetical protein